LKLLFDENLSRKLPKKLAADFPDSDHVILCGLEQAEDRVIRRHALDNKSRDEDFSLLAADQPGDPKVIWLRRDNASTSEYLRLLQTQREQIEAFANDPHRNVLVIY
jgi:predicted nuclease of predicted toxin-antitoxin system